VIGISRDDTFNEPIQPDNLDNTAPFMILEAQAMLSPCGGTVAGYIGFRRLASTDANYPGVWVRYYLTGLTNGQSYVFQIRTAGAFSATPGTQDGASATTDAGPLFNGYYPGREIGLNSVGAVNNGFNFTASGTTARGEFVDRSLWLSDYNSIIGRSAAVLVAGGVDLLSYGVIGITRESSSQRDYPGPQVLTGECFLPGIGKLTLTQGAGLSISGPSVSGPVAFGVGTQGDIFDASAGGYLFKGTSTASGCSASFNGNLGSANGAISIINNANLALRGVNSIIGRTLFISTTDSYFRSGPGTLAAPSLKQAACVVGIATENAVAPMGTGIHYLPSVATAAAYNPPPGTGFFNAASQVAISAAAAAGCLIAAVSLLLA